MRMIKCLILAVAFLLPCMHVQANGLSHVDDETPIEIQIYCDQYGEEYDICPELLEAISWRESRYNEKIVDKSGTCKGLMQIHEPSHKSRMKELGVTDLYDIESNIHVGADYLAELFDKYEDVGVVLTVYHGESNIERAKRGQLSEYVQSILKKSRYLEELHGKCEY